ncbi:hypothetical protein [Pseudonocardia spinosispora]|nr:hypothetical protein [Pseudonocardia spinosispora]
MTPTPTFTASPIFTAFPTFMALAAPSTKTLRLSTCSPNHQTDSKEPSHE